MMIARPINFLHPLELPKLQEEKQEPNNITKVEPNIADSHCINNDKR